MRFLSTHLFIYSRYQRSYSMDIPLVCFCVSCTSVIAVSIIFRAIRRPMACDSRATRAFSTMLSTLPLNNSSTRTTPPQPTTPQPCRRLGHLLCLFSGRNCPTAQAPDIQGLHPCIPRTRHLRPRTRHRQIQALRLRTCPRLRRRMCPPHRCRICPIAHAAADQEPSGRGRDGQPFVHAISRALNEPDDGARLRASRLRRP